MTRLFPTTFLCFVATTVAAEESRQLDAHEHGVGQLSIAFETDKIAMELHAPGADIVGFEYEAESAEDIAKVEAALAILAEPFGLFELPSAAGCRVSEAKASLESDAEDHDEHEDHSVDKHADDGHDDHAEDGHDDHDHKEHGDEDHADHSDEEQTGHTEFHAEYLLTCDSAKAITDIAFPYFDAFPNALELEVQAISDKGAAAFEVLRATPAVDLRDIR